MFGVFSRFLCVFQAFSRFMNKTRACMRVLYVANTLQDPSLRCRTLHPGAVLDPLSAPVSPPPLTGAKPRLPRYRGLDLAFDLSPSPLPDPSSTSAGLPSSLLSEIPMPDPSALRPVLAAEQDKPRVQVSHRRPSFLSTVITPYTTNPRARLRAKSQRRHGRRWNRIGSK